MQYCLWICVFFLLASCTAQDAGEKPIKEAPPVKRELVAPPEVKKEPSEPLAVKPVKPKEEPQPVATKAVPEVEPKKAQAEKKAPQEVDCTDGYLQVFLSDTDKSGTNIRHKPKGKVLLKLVKPDEESEFMLTVTEAKNGWFKVINPIYGGDAQVKIPNDHGWIHGSVLGVGTSNYGNQKIELFESPKKGKVVGSINKVSYDLNLKDMCGSWIKVEHKGTVGWVDGGWLCGNPWTTCP